MEYGKVIDVTEEDVEICFGIPRGGVIVEKVVPSENRVVASEWRKHIGKEDEYQIRPGHIQSTMKSTKDVNEFLRDFIILFYSCIIEPHQSGTANQNLIMPLSKMGRIKEYNWCKFVIKCLNDAKEKWIANPRALFNGPLLFLDNDTYLYWYVKQYCA